MSLKELFNKPLNISPIYIPVGEQQDIESTALVDNRIEKSNIVRPIVDYTSGSNFARFGSAELYYEDAIKRIYNTYPYDGSEAEKIDWENNCSGLDLYVFNKLYPRTNGYINLHPDGFSDGVVDPSDYDGYGILTSQNYIFVKGGSRVDNVLDMATKRTDKNIFINSADGNTVEFWLKKTEADTSKTEYETVFHVTTYNSAARQGSSGNYTELSLKLQTDPASTKPFLISYKATDGAETYDVDTEIGLGFTVTSEFGTWNHYAVSWENIGSKTVFYLYKNGELNDVVETTVDCQLLNTTDDAYVMTIGCLYYLDDTETAIGWAPLVGSIDDFRFWKAKRTHKQIKSNYFTNVFGGANTAEGNVNLGVYFKFNEGITQDSSLDSIVLDYSGRTCNGSFVGYTIDCRNTGSAIVESDAADREFLDPILYYQHEDVETLLNDKIEEGRIYDYSNGSSLFTQMPGWISDEDSIGDRYTLKKFLQIIGSYFDELFLKIQYLPKILQSDYSDIGSNKPFSFSNRLLESKGIVTPDIFIESNIINDILNRAENKNYEFNLDEVKNVIFKNIYNNIVHIFKTKGTEEAFRNLIRCFGIDEKVVRLNAYGDNATYTLKDNYKQSVEKKKVISLYSTGAFGAGVYQTIPLALNFENTSYAHEFTLESEILFPKRLDITKNNFFETTFTTSSLFGLYSYDTVQETWIESDILSSINVRAVRVHPTSDDAWFELTSSNAVIAELIPHISSSIFPDVYSDQKWSFGVKFYPEKRPFVNYVSGSSTVNNYLIEFCGYSTINDKVYNSFSVSGTVSAASAAIETFFEQEKSIYLGALRQNFTGTLLQPSDVKLLSARYWNDYLTNDEILRHAIDTTCFGRTEPYWSFATQFNRDINKSEIPKIKSLALHWNFSEVTGSDNNGNFDVKDITSSSLNSYGPYQTTLSTEYTGKGFGFPATSSYFAVREYIDNVKTALPEMIYSSDMVDVLTEDDENFTRDTRPIEHVFMFEKSMYQTISEDMINMFSSLTNFNNLIGDPINRYRMDFKDLTKLRKLYFNDVVNEPDLEKFIEYYKWIDNALSALLEQLIPASAKFIPGIRTIVENHILERNKYRNKPPIGEYKEPGSMIGDIRNADERVRWERDHISELNPTDERVNSLFFERNEVPVGDLRRTGWTMKNSISSTFKRFISATLGTGKK
jgi:hypothetical protein